MKKALLFFTTVSVLISGCMSTKYHIDKLSVKEPFAIKITDNGVVLEPDQMFSLDRLGLTANKYRYHQVGYYLIPPFTFYGWLAYLAIRSGSPIRKNTKFIDLYKHKRIKSYRITFIKNNKTYYGRIAFFDALNFAKAKAVCSYYRITVPADKLSLASEGRTACVYEYYDKSSGKTQFPTWIIWMSDADIF